ncbi:regulator of nucleoside diphosphate kinase [Gillisia sp. Hel1_33_143]|nr:regulator of nucleoside diphosphate kinase [Gillisia sp. Hel1_33_143]
MKYGALIIERSEFDILKELLALSRHYKDEIYKASVSKLQEQMLTAKILKSDKIPEDNIRLNSTVTIKSEFDVERTYKIVTPDNADLRDQKVSILAPLGLALFGHAEGDEIRWKFPVGERIIKIVKVIQQPILKNKRYDKQYSGAS